MAKSSKNSQGKKTEAAANTHVMEAAASPEQNTPAPSKESKPRSVKQLSDTKRRIDS